MASGFSVEKNDSKVSNTSSHAPSNATAEQPANKVDQINRIRTNILEKKAPKQCERARQIIGQVAENYKEKECRIMLLTLMALSVDPELRPKPVDLLKGLGDINTDPDLSAAFEKSCT